MSATTSFANQILDLLFNNTDIDRIGDATGLQGSTTVGNFYIALFTANPGEAGSYTNEATFGGYARVAVPRTAAWWDISSDSIETIQDITFPECTGGSETITHYGILKADVGTSVDDFMYYAALDSSQAVSVGITLEFQAGDITIDLQ
jgi:hypothetical protein